MYQSGDKSPPSKEVQQFRVAAVLGPACGGGVDLRVFDGSIGAVVEEVLDHRAVAVEGGVVQTSAGEIKAARNRVDLRAFFKQEFRSVDVTVHAGVDERVVHDALTILRPRVDAMRKSLAKRPVNPARFGLETSIGIEIAPDEISATQPGSRANVLNLR